MAVTCFQLTTKSEIQKKYREGLAGTTLANFYGVSKATIYRVLRELGTERRPPKIAGLGREPLAPNQENTLINLYLEGQSAYDIPNKVAFHTNPSEVYRILAERGIPRRPNGFSNRKFFFDFDFFKHQNPISAYWAGFIMADGNIHQKARTTHCGCLRINLAIKDLEHLRRFCLDIGCPTIAIKTHTITKTIKNPFCSLQLNHPKLGESLKTWGIVPRKTYNFVEPQVCDKVMSHYLRGWIDGDGSIWVPSIKEIRRARFQLVGNHEAVAWFLGKLNEYHLQTKTKVQKCKNSPIKGSFSIGGAYKLLRIYLMLDGSNERRLDRKWAALGKVLEQHDFPRRNRSVMRETK